MGVRTDIIPSKLFHYIDPMKISRVCGDLEYEIHHAGAVRVKLLERVLVIVIINKRR